MITGNYDDPAPSGQQKYSDGYSNMRKNNGTIEMMNYIGKTQTE